MIAASNDQEPAVTSPAMPPVPAIDIVAGIFDEEALSYRPGWQEGFFSGKMKAKANMKGVSLEQQLEQMASAGIERAFLFAPKVGRKGLPGSFHLPYELVARAVEKYPGRFYGMAGIDPYEGMNGVRALEDAVKNMGFIGAHLYPHWFDLPPDHAKYYPFYAKCCELGVPIQMQVGQSMMSARPLPARSRRALAARPQPGGASRRPNEGRTAIRIWPTAKWIRPVRPILCTIRAPPIA